MNPFDGPAGQSAGHEKYAHFDEERDLMRGASPFKPLVFLALPYVLITAIVIYRLWW